MTTVYDLKQLPTMQNGPSTLSAVRSNNSLVTYLNIEPTPDYPRKPHRHPYDQLCICIKGELILEIEGIEHHLTPFTALLVAAGAWHRGRAASKVEMFELFSPPRTDYIHLTSTQNEVFADATGSKWFYDDESMKGVCCNSIAIDTSTPPGS